MCYFFSVFSMSEDDGHESGCDTVEGSPTSNTSASPHGNSPYHYLNNNNRNGRPPLPAMVAQLATPVVQGRSPHGVRTMVVPPMRVQNNNTRRTEERVRRTSEWCCLYMCVCTVCLVLSKPMIELIVKFILCIAY